MDDDLSGLTHWTLTFNHPLGRAYCSKIIREIVQDWLSIRKGPPPLDARNRSKAILRIALVGQSNQFESRLHMEFWPNGDPSKRDCIEVWLPVGTEVDRAFLVEAVARSIIFIAFSRSQPVIKRHRWRGIYFGLSAFILLDCLFGIAPELLHRFRQEVKRVLSSSSSSRATSAAASAADSAAAANASQASIAMPSEGNVTYEDPEISRRKAAAWIESKPAARCKMFRMIIEPIRQYQCTKAHVASQADRRTSQIIDVLSLQGQPANLAKQIPFYTVIAGEIEETALGRLAREY